MNSPDRVTRIHLLLSAASGSDDLDMRRVYVAGAVTTLRALEDEVRRLRVEVEAAEKELVRRAGPAQRTIGFDDEAERW